MTIVDGSSRTVPRTSEGGREPQESILLGALGVLAAIGAMVWSAQCMCRSSVAPVRRGVLQLLKRGPMGAGELAEHFDVTKPTMSAHFAVLLHAGLIHAEKRGRSITYRLRMSVLEEALLGFAQAFGLEVTSREGNYRIAGARAEKGRR